MTEGGREELPDALPGDAPDRERRVTLLVPIAGFWEISNKERTNQTTVDDPIS